MINLRLYLTITLVTLAGILAGCSKQPSANLDEVMTLYRANKIEQALPLFEQLVAQDRDNPEDRVWLAETYRRLGKKEEAIKMARQALALEPCNSFAHTVIAEAANPVMGMWTQANSDTTWFHIMKAVTCDSTDGNPWLLIWGEAIHRGDPALMRKALRRLVETGFLTNTALAYGRWMLQGLPENAILITNGDMDTYPPCAVQEVDGFRRDVAIVNCGTLNEDWYARFIRDDAGVPLPFDDEQLQSLKAFKDQQGNVVTPSDQIFRKWVEQKARGAFNRPLAVAVTVNENYFADCKDNMQFSGAFLQWHDATIASTPDTAAMLASLAGFNPEDFTGVWISDQDRSPIRRVYTKNLVRNITETAIGCSEALLTAKRTSAAKHWANWADELDGKAELGPVFTTRIADLQKRLTKTTD